MRLLDKVALVTGGGRGIGRGIALGFAREGAEIVVVSRTFREVEETATEVRRLSRRALALTADVRVPEEVQRATEETLREFGRIDILVNSAGIPMISPSLELSFEEWRRCLDTNLNGSFLFCQMIGREMIRAGRGGKIINITSIHAFATYPERAAYAASKGGLVALTRALGIEWARHGICVNAIAPGQTRTGLQDDLIARGILDAGRIAARTPAGRLGEVEDIVGPAIFLASRESDFIVGETIVVDGGWLASAYY